MLQAEVAAYGGKVDALQAVVMRVWDATTPTWEVSAPPPKAAGLRQLHVGVGVVVDGIEVWATSLEVLGLVPLWGAHQVQCVRVGMGTWKGVSHPPGPHAQPVQRLRTSDPHSGQPGKGALCCASLLVC